ncbi:MAG: polyhydroxyalkanoic acid system family protein [Pirellulales bacterium]
MTTFSTEVAHDLGLEEALTRLQDFVEQTQKRYRDQISHVDGQWTDNVLLFSLTTSGMTVQGQMIVEEDIVRVKGKLPLLATPFRGVIQKSITAELVQALS